MRRRQARGREPQPAPAGRVRSASATQRLDEQRKRLRRLAPRDRSLITVACPVAMDRINEMPFHFKRAPDSGVT